ncbi:cob(I)yrinic acid a,c-diamide adenosyltransferase [Candidatus Marinimicrobia bacterium]|jgi:cob(I)alamin adenosyltransferase|nr:cob(I)yrinic acid a,c-diamide adenosyltransferase [Candidatus Neomarinimicrobiota bacterium]|tara:strand:+ start:3422 stop:3967 length:546 start_codon:yes stop_codon:yes gene_type:complete
MRITKVTTKTGDDGKTSLGDGKRVKKNHVIIDTLGELDNLNAVIGWAEVSSSSKKYSKDLKSIQQDIFNISGDISLPDGKSKLLKEERIFFLEDKIKVMSKNLPPLKEFILPGGSEFNARLHILRTTARNTERCLVAMQQDEGKNSLHLKYLNRLSDYLFLLARAVGLSENLEEEHWELNK